MQQEFLKGQVWVNLKVKAEVEVEIENSKLRTDNL